MADKKIGSVAKDKKKNISTFTVQQKEGLLDCLLSQLSQKKRKILKVVLRDRQVLVDGKVVTQFDHILTPGQSIEVRWERSVSREKPRELNIVFEDQDLVIVNKPAGLLSVATDKEKRKTAYSMLSTYIKQENPDNKIFVVHRLDRETSGLIMFAKSEKVKHKIQESWETTISQRTYVGVVEGEVIPESGTITSWLTESKAFIVYSSQNPTQGRKAVTHYKRIQGNAHYSLLELQLETGRKHQIRVHMQEINHPIIGDKKYGSKLSPIRRMGLHARVLAFTHPTTGESCHFETPVPKKFLSLFSTRAL